MFLAISQYLQQWKFQNKNYTVQGCCDRKVRRLPWLVRFRFPETSPVYVKNLLFKCLDCRNSGESVFGVFYYYLRLMTLSASLVMKILSVDLPLLQIIWIVDGANSKSHQQIVERNWDFYYPTSGKSAKLFTRNTLVRYMLYETHARIYNMCTLITQHCVKFNRHVAWQLLLVILIS